MCLTIPRTHTHSPQSYARSPTSEHEEFNRGLGELWT